MRNYFIYIFWISLFITFTLSCENSTDYEDDIRADLIISQEIFSSEDTLYGTYSVTNNTQETKSFYFNSSCQFSYVIYQNGIILYHKPTGCRASQSEFHLLSGESKHFDFSYSLIDKENKKLPSGDYEIEAFLIDTRYLAQKNFQID
jgi:hypothetical protein